MAKVKLEKDPSTEIAGLMEEDETNEEVTAEQDYQEQPFSKNGSPLRPPLNPSEEDNSEDENDEDSSPLDPLYSHDQEDLGPPVGAAPKTKEKKRASSPRLPVTRTVLPPPDGITLSGYELVGIIVGYDDHARPHGRDVRPLIAARNARGQPFQGCDPPTLSC